MPASYKNSFWLLTFIPWVSKSPPQGQFLPGYIFLYGLRAKDGFILLNGWGKKRIFYENYEIQVSLSQNNILFKHRHGHLFLGYLWLFSHDNVVTAEIIKPEKPKYLLPGSSQKNLADS